MQELACAETFPVTKSGKYWIRHQGGCMGQEDIQSGLVCEQDIKEIGFSPAPMRIYRGDVSGELDGTEQIKPNKQLSF